MEEEIPHFEPYDDDDTHETDDAERPQVSEEDDPVGYNKYVSVKVQSHRDSMLQKGVVKGRKLDVDGKMIGNSHENPILDSALCEVEFEDGQLKLWLV